MTTQLELAEVPMAAHARREDPATSHAAAASVDRISEKQRAVLACFAPNGNFTKDFVDEELIEHYRKTQLTQPQTDSGIRSRRAELVRLGKVKESGEFRLTAAGRKSTVWRLA